jgi:hypothetical protein
VAMIGNNMAGAATPSREEAADPWSGINTPDRPLTRGR